MTDTGVLQIGQQTDTTLSLPEELQLALPLINGKLRFGSMDLAVAAIIDLALRGRLVATKLRFAQPSSAKLTLVDATPTGNEVLDTVLRAFVARGKPWKVYPAVTTLAGVATDATVDSLVARGALAAHGTRHDRDGHVEPLDQALREASVARLERTSSAEDPQGAMLADIRHHSAWGWSPTPGQIKPPVLGDYPENVGIAARGALSALYIASGSAA